MPIFENATARAGLSGNNGLTYALTWGDIDSDGFPDIWASHHNKHALTPGSYDLQLFHLHNGTFTDVTTSVPKLLKDYHGAAWADFDNDGDKDLAQTTGGTSVGGVTLFRNDGGVFHDATAAVGLAETSNAAGRNSVWLDYDNDGLLDFYLGATRTSSGGSAGRPSSIYHQTSPGHFADANAAVGLTKDGVDPYLADLDGDGRPELIVCSYGAITAIYKTTTLPWHDIKGTLLAGLTIPHFDDIAIADFNNDLRPDIYITRRGFEDEVISSGPKSLRSYIAAVPPGQEHGFTFTSAGDPIFTFSKFDASIDFDLIRVGASGRHPITNLNNTQFQLTRAADAGIMPHNLTTPGIYIGYDRAAGAWEYDVVGSAKASRGNTVTSASPITDLQTHGFPLHPMPQSDQLLINNGRGFDDVSVASRVSTFSIAGQHLATGDFDNDGRVDLYVDQAGPAANRGNLVLLNRGDGTFVNTGPNGASGPGLLGLGGPVAVADYDHDGFLDVLSSNAAGEPPFIPLNADGPLRLFRNLGNANHWLEIRLHGTQSNADGLGAKVVAIAGSLQQMREEVDGQHNAGQDSSVLHFGLGQRGSVDTLEVHWPSGHVDRLTHVVAGQILDITEGEAPVARPGQQSSLDGAGHASTPGDETTDLSAAAPGSAETPLQPGTMIDDFTLLSLLDGPQAWETGGSHAFGGGADGLDSLSWADAPVLADAADGSGSGGAEFFLL